VMLSIADIDAARRAYDILLARAAEQAPRARIEGVMVTAMAKKGAETIIGVNCDPVFGPVVMFGMGGIFTELLKDVSFRVAPFDREEAHRMIREIKGYPLLRGFRGTPPADIEALAEVLQRLSQFAAANASELESIDLNPVVVLPEGEGVYALDAVIIARAR
jgi:acetate---CoA ligase (ADP-forming)